MTVEDLIKLEIEKTKKELNRLELLLPKANGNEIEVCPICKTKNYYYNVKDNSRTCAFC